MKQFSTHVVVLLVVSSLIVGCSSKPSAADGKEVIEKQIQNESQGRIKLLDFDKIDGQMREVSGVKVYWACLDKMDTNSGGFDGV